MNQFVQNILNSFNTAAGGFSARKLSAFIIMVCVVVAHVAWLKHAFQKEDFSLLTEVFLIDYGFVSVCLGMTTYEYLSRNKKGLNNEQEPNKDN